MQTISLDELERRLIVRKRELGIIGVDFLPVNDGARRTASKAALAASHRRECRRPRADAALRDEA